MHPALFTSTIMIAALAAGAAGAPGWRPVTAADLAGTPDLARRTAGTLDLEAAGDFDGDGRADRVAIRQQPGRYGVVATLAGRETVVTTGPGAHLASLGVHARPATDPQCRAIAGRGRAACIEVFAFEASATLYRWDGRRFVERNVAD
jgi:hypothetical protein